MTLTMIVTWLSVNLGLPAIYEHPRIEFVSQAEMQALPAAEHYPRGRADSASRTHYNRSYRAGSNIQALYDDRTRTIYLSSDWEGATPAELSILVHEMVHHLQNAGGLKYECAQAREKPAYRAQDKWLALSGRNLLEEFKLDAMTMLVRTNCMH